MLALAVSGCATTSPSRATNSAEPEEREEATVLTAEEIEDLGCRHALDAVTRAFHHLIVQQTREGSPGRVYRRGVSSIVLSPMPLVVIDGSRVRGFEVALRSVPAVTIVSIEMLSGREGTMKWGADGGNGVILVRTSASG